MTKAALILLASSALLLLNTACVAPETRGKSEANENAAAAATEEALRLSQNSGLTRDPATQVITDGNAKLQWEDNANEPITTTWPEANEHCSDLDFANHQDWRLATTEELVALAKATKVKFPKKPMLKSIPTFHGEYWTSDTQGSRSMAAAKAVKFDTFDWGEIVSGMQYLDYSVRCVRNLQ